MLGIWVLSYMAWASRCRFYFPRQCDSLNSWNDDDRTPRFLFMYLLNPIFDRTVGSPWRKTQHTIMNETNAEQSTNMVKEKEVPIKDFIRKNLYPAIEILKDNGHPYFAFELIAAGIEFLGACMDDKDFHQRNLGRKRFESAIKKLSSLRKYDFPNNKLYDNLRCGMCHILLQTTTLKLSSGYGKCSGSILYIENFYCDFKSTCEELLNDCTNLWGNEKSPDSICWTVSENYNTAPTTAATDNDKVTME